MENIDNRINLLNLNFRSFSLEEKRAAFTIMDVMMKKLHDKNLMVTDFNPGNIYFQDGIYCFDKVSPISDYYVDNKEKAILRNIMGLSNLAFCSYLPDYNLKYGLLSYDVIHQHFNEFISYFPEADRDYYKTIFIDSYENKKLPSDTVYFSDYVIKQHQNSSNSNGNSLAYIKATEAGRAFANQDEAAFGHRFFFLTVVASIMVALVGFIIYFSRYLG